MIFDLLVGLGQLFWIVVIAVGVTWALDWIEELF